MGVAVDVYHVWWDPDLARQIERAGEKRLLAFHLCDWLVPTTDLLYDRGMMGDGVIDIPRIRSWMEAAGLPRHARGGDLLEAELVEARSGRGVEHVSRAAPDGMLNQPSHRFLNSGSTRERRGGLAPSYRDDLMAKHRIGIIGLGMALKPHALCLRDLAGRVEVAAAFAPSRERREQAAKDWGFPVVDSLDADARRPIDRRRAHPRAAVGAHRARRLGPPRRASTCCSRSRSR